MMMQVYKSKRPWYNTTRSKQRLASQRDEKATCGENEKPSDKQKSENVLKMIDDVLMKSQKCILNAALYDVDSGFNELDMDNSEMNSLPSEESEYEETKGTQSKLARKPKRNYQPSCQLETQILSKTKGLERQLQSASSLINKNEIIDLRSENQILRQNLNQIGSQFRTQSIYEKTEKVKRYETAVAQYRLEIHQNRSDKNADRSGFYLQRVTELEELLVDLKVENCALKTTNQSMEILVMDIQDYYEKVEQAFDNLTRNVEERFANYATRLDRAFEKLFKLNRGKKSTWLSLFKN